MRQESYRPCPAFFYYRVKPGQTLILAPFGAKRHKKVEVVYDLRAVFEWARQPGYASRMTISQDVPHIIP